MSDAAEVVSLEDRLQAIRQLAEDETVRRFGVRRTYVHDALGVELGRVFLSLAGEVRILSANDVGEFVPGSLNDQQVAALLAKDVGSAAPEDSLMDLAEQHAEATAGERGSAARDPSYVL